MLYSCSYLVMNLMPSVEEIERKRKQLLYFLFVLKRLEFIGFVNRTQLMQHCLYVLAAAMMTVDFVCYSCCCCLCLNVQMQLLTQIRLAMSFSSHEKRLQCVQARLQAISTLGIYSVLDIYSFCL